MKTGMHIKRLYMAHLEASFLVAAHVNMHTVIGEVDMLGSGIYITGEVYNYNLMGKPEMVLAHTIHSYNYIMYSSSVYIKGASRLFEPSVLGTIT